MGRTFFPQNFNPGHHKPYAVKGKAGSKDVFKDLLCNRLCTYIISVNPRNYSAKQILHFLLTAFLLKVKDLSRGHQCKRLIQGNGHVRSGRLGFSPNARFLSLQYGV